MIRRYVKFEHYGKRKEEKDTYKTNDLYVFNE